MTGGEITKKPQNKQIKKQNKKEGTEIKVMQNTTSEGLGV